MPKGKTQGPVWVVAQQTDGQLLSVSLQLMGSARMLADQLGTFADAILLGDRVEDIAKQLIAATWERPPSWPSTNPKPTPN
jgi:electron transfer flavoprotein alpha subunit